MKAATTKLIPVWPVNGLQCKQVFYNTIPAHTEPLKEYRLSSQLLLSYKFPYNAIPACKNIAGTIYVAP